MIRVSLLVIMNQFQSPIPVVLGLCLLAGCGEPKPERATVSGRITFEGKPVDYGHIVFVPVDGWDGFYSQATIINGEYSLDEHGPVLGKNRVEVHGQRKTGELAPNISGVRLNEQAKIAPVTEAYLPAKYNVASEITVEIRPGKNENVDFILE